MAVTIHTVNENGLKEIHKFLTDNHKMGAAFDRAMLLSWALDAEFQMAEGNAAMIEIKSSDSMDGITHQFIISAAGVDKETVELD